jgi:hypothetical protein
MPAGISSARSVRRSGMSRSPEGVNIVALGLTADGATACLPCVVFAGVTNRSVR